MAGETPQIQPSTEAQVENLHIRSLHPILTPREVKMAYPASKRSILTAAQGREAIRSSLDVSNSDDRLIVVTGGCSVHSPSEALEYTAWLKDKRSTYAGELELVQRVYFEKPRTTTGWEGLINDPGLDETFDINSGLLTARKLVTEITDAGVPIGTELLDNITIDYYAGLVSWGAIGARTTESPLHRHLASGLSFPVGFKNGTSGDVQVAVNGVVAASYPHHFLATSDEGRTAIAATKGNPDSHIILRGGSEGPNYDEASIAAASEILTAASLAPVMMVDASHANSQKDYRKQIDVVRTLAEQIASGSTNIIGVMIEGNIREGSQSFTAGTKPEYGISITDGCVGLEENELMLQILSTAVKARR